MLIFLARGMIILLLVEGEAKAHIGLRGTHEGEGRRDHGVAGNDGERLVTKEASNHGCIGKPKRIE